MRVAVTGATGFVGRRVVDQLLGRGLEVRALCRTSPVRRFQPAEVDVRVIGPIAGDTEWGDALEQVDAVVHLAARVHVLDERERAPLAAYREVNVEGTLALARAAVAAGVRRFLFMSSIKVNGEETTGALFTETSRPEPRDPYGVSKWEAEQGLWEIARESDLEVVVLRPPLVYGPGVKANFQSLIRAVDRGIPFPFGTLRNQRSLVFVGNLADAVACSLERPAAAGETFLVSDGAAVSSGELVRVIGRALGRRPRLLPVPPGLMRLTGRVLRREAFVQRILGSLQVDSSHIRRTLDWTPPYTMTEGLAETARWWRSTHD
jgi:UDP-glucose 4-epimerase